jgi:hypothetical protein
MCFLLFPGSPTHWHMSALQHQPLIHSHTIPNLPTVYNMSDPRDTTARMATHSCNATAHPGLVDTSLKQTYGEKSMKEMAEEWKKAKLQKKQDAICKISEVEKRMADDQMVDVTPGPRATGNRHQTC